MSSAGDFPFVFDLCGVFDFPGPRFSSSSCGLGDFPEIVCPMVQPLGLGFRI